MIEEEEEEGSGKEKEKEEEEANEEEEEDNEDNEPKEDTLNNNDAANSNCTLDNSKRVSHKSRKNAKGGLRKKKKGNERQRALAKNITSQYITSTENSSFRLSRYLRGSSLQSSSSSSVIHQNLVIPHSKVFLPLERHLLKDLVIIFKNDWDKIHDAWQKMAYAATSSYAPAVWQYQIQQKSKDELKTKYDCILLERNPDLNRLFPRSSFRNGPPSTATSSTTSSSTTTSSTTSSSVLLPSRGLTQLQFNNLLSRLGKTVLELNSHTIPDIPDVPSDSDSDNVNDTENVDIIVPSKTSKRYFFQFFLFSLLLMIVQLNYFSNTNITY